MGSTLLAREPFCAGRKRGPGRLGDVVHLVLPTPRWDSGLGAHLFALAAPGGRRLAAHSSVDVLFRAPVLVPPRGGAGLQRAVDRPLGAGRHGGGVCARPVPAVSPRAGAVSHRLHPRVDRALHRHRLQNALVCPGVSARLDFAGGRGRGRPLSLGALPRVAGGGGGAAGGGRGPLGGPGPARGRAVQYGPAQSLGVRAHLERPAPAGGPRPGHRPDLRRPRPDAGQRAGRRR
jgi:hypothetical protein